MIVEEPLPVDISLAVERLGLEAELVHELVHTFLQEAPRHIRFMQRALIRTDVVSLERAAHTLRGTSASLCMDRVCTYACRLEALAHEGRMERVPLALDALQMEVRRLDDYLSDLLARNI